MSQTHGHLWKNRTENWCVIFRTSSQLSFDLSVGDTMDQLQRLPIPPTATTILHKGYTIWHNLSQTAFPFLCIFYIPLKSSLRCSDRHSQCWFPSENVTLNRSLENNGHQLFKVTTQITRCRKEQKEFCLWFTSSFFTRIFLQTHRISLVLKAHAW